MSTQFYDLDPDAKLPIIRADSTLDLPPLNGNSDGNNLHDHPQQNGLITNQPSFRLAQNYDYKKRTHTASKRRGIHSKESYFHYEEPSPQDLLKRVEYDMDQQDTEWLQLFNNKNSAKNNYEISENDFERIMDRLEKESYFETKKSGKEIVPEVDEDAVCAICSDGDCHNANMILFCDMCDLAVHQECYGVPYVPEGQWLCRRCLQSPSQNVSCVLCPNMGGAFKQTDDNRWAHVICALWIPEVCFANTVFLEPIDNINQIPQARWKLNCYICKQKKVGACIQCHKPNCYVPFHVTCAQQAGLYMKISTEKYDTANGPLIDVKKEAFCDLHGPSDGSNKTGMYTGDETDDEDVDTQAYKKWKRAKREKLKKTRKILAEKREKAFNPIAEPKVEEEKLIEISKLLSTKGKKKPQQQFDDLRLDIIRHILGYWLEKRKKRNGVPLIRRLQVSYNNSVPKTPTNMKDLDKSKYTQLRYDLEKARLLVGEVKKREVFKKRLFNLSRQIVEQKFKVIDKEDPPDVQLNK